MPIPVMYDIYPRCISLYTSNGALQSCIVYSWYCQASTNRNTHAHVVCSSRIGDYVTLLSRTWNWPEQEYNSGDPTTVEWLYGKCHRGRCPLNGGRKEGESWKRYFGGWGKPLSLASAWDDSSKSRRNEIVELSAYTEKSYGALDWLR